MAFAKTAGKELRVSPRPGFDGEGLIIGRGTVIRCALGRSGIRHAKREGDGATPAGSVGPLAVLYRPDRGRRPRSLLPAIPIEPDDGWCDDPQDRNYNRAVRLPYAASHERLWRDDHLYDVVVVLDWNFQPPLPGRGSAIFLHLARPGLLPTEGCIAVTRPDMDRLLARLEPRSRIRIG